MTPYRQAAAEVRACLENSSALGEWPVVRLLALLESSDPMPVPRAMLVRWIDIMRTGLEHYPDPATCVSCKAVAELAALLNKEGSP
jgi:hypothetical protein